jgi:nicotinic acid mononucleotide adenylyltransferase
MVRNRTIVVAFGRFNPPTTGHARLFAMVEREAERRMADMAVFAFPTEDDDRNPLPFREKIQILRQMFPTMLFNTHEQIRNPYHALWCLLHGGYEHVVIVTGEDRIPEYTKLMDAFPKFKSIDLAVIERDGVSATKMRRAVQHENLAGFLKYCPTRNRRIATQLYERLRTIYETKYVTEIRTH